MTHFPLFGLYFGEKYSYFLSKPRYQINGAPSAQLLIFQRPTLGKKNSKKKKKGVEGLHVFTLFLYHSWQNEVGVRPHIRLNHLYDRTQNSTTQIKRLSKAGKHNIYQLFLTVAFDMLHRISASI